MSTATADTSSRATSVGPGSFVSLKLLVLANLLRRRPWQLTGVAIGLLYGLGSLVILVGGLLALRHVDLELTRSVTVVFGAVVVLLFTVVPLVLGIDDHLDPRRFALYGMTTNRLTLGLALGALVSVPSLFITVVAIAFIALWSRSPAASGFSVASAILILVTCVLSARVTTAVSGFLRSSRRSVDVTVLVGIVLLVCLGPIIAALAAVDWNRAGLSVLTNIERAVAWSPVGAAWAVPADVAAGDTRGALWKLAIAVGWALLLLGIWRALVGRSLVVPDRQAAARRYAGLGWFDRLPARPAGAIAARNLVYWGRDSRYGASLVVIPLIPIVMVIALWIGGFPLHDLALLPLPVICLFLSWAVHNDVSFDNTAIWLHLSSSVRGRSDRWGRIIPVLFVGVPVVAIGSVLSAFAFGEWSVLPAVVGVAGCILLSGLGLSSVVSAAFPYPSVRPGESPFAQPNSGSSSAGLAQALSFTAILVLAVPSVAFGLLGLTHSHAWYLAALIVGLGIGVVVLLAGISLGGRLYDRRGSDLLVSATRN